MEKHPIRFVGAGPGDPELITVKGRRFLEEADRVVYTGSLIPQSLLQFCRSGIKLQNSARLTLAETHALLKEGFELGQQVVRLHTGDPSLYGAIREQMDLLDRDGIPYEVVPGVSAAFAAAAAMHRELTVPEVSQTVILTRMGGNTPVPDEERLARLASHKATLVVYLSVQQIQKVVSELLESYPTDTPVIVGYRIGWPEQLMIRGTLSDIAEKVREAKISRQAVIMVGEVFGSDPSGKGAKRRSKLYDESFSHGYRKAGGRGPGKDGDNSADKKGD